MTHVVGDKLLNEKVNVHVVGCGGTGSAVVPGLAKIHRSLLALGHPGGLHITIWDDDKVALHNCIRQNFYEVDVGHGKASIMANRMGIAHAPAHLEVEAREERFPGSSTLYEAIDIVIGCVDSKSSRRDIETFMRTQARDCYWIDCGNERDSGQVIIGQCGREIADDRHRLPMVSELFPEIVTGDDDHAPSCSAVQSIFSQGVLTNTMAAAWALAWLDETLRHGRIEWSGVFFNIAGGRTTAIAAEPDAWARYGYHATTPCDRSVTDRAGC